MIHEKDLKQWESGGFIVRTKTDNGYRVSLHSKEVEYGKKEDQEIYDLDISQVKALHECLEAALLFFDKMKDSTANTAPVWLAKK